MEKTFIIIKPDAIERKLVGKIITKIELNNLNILFAKKLMLTEDQAKEHYSHIKELDFYHEMISYYTSHPVLAMIIEGENAIIKMRELAGNSIKPSKGTIRSDLGSNGYKNLIHTADSIENYKIEVERFLNKFLMDTLLK